MKIKFLIICLIATIGLQAQISSTEIDELVNNAITSFNVPGISVSVVKDGKVIHSKGYGVTSTITKQTVTENTLFGIASNSKAFTAAALAILVDEGKIKWNDKVITYLPNFEMYDAYVTNHFTIRDLLTHRSGLGLGAGDLMIWPDGSNFTPNDIINNLKYLKPVSEFRTKFDYDNLLYIVAGEIIHKVSGKKWADFVETKIMQPLKMSYSAGSYNNLKDTTNIATPHVPINNQLKPIARYKNTILDAAGGIYSSVNEMNNWVLMQLNNGVYGDDKKSLFSNKEHNEMWSLQTILPAATYPPYNTQFSGYGLGWFLSDVKGYKEISHTGGLEGMVTQVTLIPELKLGIVVLTNQQSGAAFTAITNTIKNSYLEIAPVDYVKLYSAREKSMAEVADKTTDEAWKKVVENKKIKFNFNNIIGTYADNWFGEISIYQKKGKTYFQSKRSPQLKGELFYYNESTLIVKWDNRYLHADAFLQFTIDNNNKAQNITMKAISPLTDFSYDFHDLNFNRVN